MNKFIAYSLLLLSFLSHSISYASKPYNEIEIKTVDLDDYPKKGESYAAGTEVTIGDLHGNALKLVHFLLRTSVMKINREEYDTLHDIYEKKPEHLQAKDIAQFKSIINQADYNPQQKIRFLGDDLCDRGMNDYFTLVIYEKLDKEAVPFEVVLSNHGNFFIGAYESPNHDFGNNPYGKGNSESIVRSMLNMAKTIESGLVSKDEVIQIVQNHYLKHVVFPGFVINKKKKELTVFSHAPIDMKMLGELAKELDLPFEDKKLSDVEVSLNAINKLISQWIMSNTFANHYNELKEKHKKAQTANPLEQVIWNRDYTILNRNHEVEDRPYDVNYVHGHDSQPNVFDLDNLLGKSSKENKGPFAIHLTHE